MKADQPSPESYAHAAWFLRCDVAAIMAVAEVESRASGAFLPSGEPVILYEPHYFSSLTNNRFDKTNPLLSYPKWKAHMYGKASEQHGKLAEAAALDRDAALKSCSWGLFQIMGANYRRAGFQSVQDMVTAAYRDVDEHLRMFVWFIATDTRDLARALCEMGGAPALSAAIFARGYNGAGYKENKYDERIAAAYARLAR